LGVREARRVVLLSFGGCDIQGIDFDQVERLDEMQFLTTHPMPRPMRNVRQVTLTGFHHVDLVAQADAVITKPGYGIVSECLANRIPVLYTSREAFAEYAPLVDGLNRFGVCRFIEHADLLAGRWRDALEGLWEQPRTWSELPCDGARVAAEILEGILARA
jgi:L-arabinokinase